MNEWTVVADLTVLLGVGLLLGALCERMRQSAIVGYLIAGMLLGPNALQVLSTTAEVELLAELGVALLLFAVGLEFSWRRLRAMGRVSLGGGAVQVVATGALAMGLAVALGLPGRAAIVLGFTLALSSTACVLRVLEARGELETVHGTESLGILLVQDLAVIPCVMLVTTLTQEDGSAGVIALHLGKALLLGALAAVGLYIVFTMVVPRLLSLGPVHASRELSVLTAIVSGLTAVVLAHKAGLSPGLGAFIAGILLAASPFATQVRADLSALRTLFVTVFFSSIGALGDPGWMLANWHLVVPAVVAIVCTKSVITWAALRAFGAGAASALAAGICLGQIGEFSFILIEIARGTLISHDLFLLLVSSTLITMLLTPFLVAAAPKIAGRLLRSRGPRAVGSASIEGSEPSPHQAHPDVLIIGFGPAGQVIAERVCEKGGRVLVLDLNPHGVATARRLGFAAVLGDGQHEEILLRVSVREARCVVVTVPAPTVAIQIVRLVRIIAPGSAVVARSRYNRFYRELGDAGAHAVHDEETLVGKEMTTSVLNELGVGDTVDLGAPPDVGTEREGPAG